MIDSGLVGSMGGVPRDQKMFKGHLPRVIYHQVYEYTKKKIIPDTPNAGGAGNFERDPEGDGDRVCAGFSSEASLRGGPHPSEEGTPQNVLRVLT